ncbi:ubiquitin-specific protease UBP2 [Aspergillus tanneri]|uniref:ubiquitinyl hydrolase 1 n=1 Tax=Aspergillus tanneri TaxID=1220188 RepID=A0A5M9MY43_9EURO|nr:ubiquitin-specific protease ubp2 [Aspergillus tanneri]KAA8649813.1 ubiquitin-specific protease ubp2 [Aspergillus tanneri]
MSSFQRSGKTAPRLVQDILDYDFFNPPSTGRNLLSDVPPVFTERYSGPPEYISPSACRHGYVTKPGQSFLQQGAGSPPTVSAMCLKCRCHLQVVVSRTSALGTSGQGLADHLHHLIYKSGKHRGGTSPEEITPKGQIVETYHYECSYLSCSTGILVRVASPVLNQDSVRLLTDPELLRERAEEAIASYPDRLEGVALPLPINVLLNLRAYLYNALNNGQHSKSISAVNKRFMTCFGVEGMPCKDLLEFLEFSVKNEGFWEPPRPSPWTEFPYRDQLKIFLDDTIHELTALIEQRPLEEKKAQQIEFKFNPASNDLLSALGALDYPKALRSNEFQMAPEPYYDDLGAVEDMSSSLIIDAFNRQVSVDPARSSIYLECLKSIGNLRGGEDGDLIEQAVQVAYAEGKYTNEDVVNAYRYFGLSHDDTRLTEDSIIGKFYAYLSSTNQEHETRQQLWRIGNSRRSERIKSAAEDRVSTVEQAQVFLGVGDDTSDDFIMAMYTAKVNDSPSTRDPARRAVELIAEARKSSALKHFLKTGEMTAGEMDIGDAYRLLQIPDRTVDEDAIMAAYTICVDEAPAQIDTYNQALQIIAKEMNNPLLSNAISCSAVRSDRDMSEWPFYFSVRPFREMVLNFDDFKMAVDDESLNKKQVGSRKVAQKEVERSQEFLRELRALFHDMITSPDLDVPPETKLAKLTLFSPSSEAAIRRRSTKSVNRPVGLGEINGLAIMGPLGPPQSTSDGEVKDLMAIDTDTTQRSATSDLDSEATLVEGAKNDAPVAPSEDKENEPPLADAVMTDAQGGSVPEPLEHSRPNHTASTKQAPSPAKPPPVPPRPTPQGDPQRQQELDEVAIGAQQDVTEVINNLLFQSQCAIRPSSIAADGEQIDRVKDLFYGKAKSYILSKEGTRSKEEWWCDIKVDVATGPRDIYTAIDGAFDVQKVHVGNSVAEQFGAISKLPPVLQIQVQRVQFDPVTKSQFKSTHHLELKETIYLDRYMDTQQPEILNRRRQCWEWKDKLRMLEARRTELLQPPKVRNLDISALMDGAHDVLEDLNSLKENLDTAEASIDIHPELVRGLGQLSEIARSELNSIDQEIKNTQTMISSQFADYRFLPYRIYAVFVHRGSVEVGHYYIYIRDFERNIWRKYNDSYVTEVHDLDEIFSNPGGKDPPTPYFVVYVNDDKKDRLVNPLRRQVAQNTSLPHTLTEGTTAPAGTEDADVKPPTYDEACADKGASGMGDQLHVENQETNGGKAAKQWASSRETNSKDVHW